MAPIAPALDVAPLAGAAFILAGSGAWVNEVAAPVRALLSR